MKKKPLFDKKKLKGKGLDKHKVKSKKPIQLDEVEQNKNPFKLTFSWGDRLNRFGMWLQGFVVDAAGEIIKRVIPGWFWILLVVGIIIIAIIVL